MFVIKLFKIWRNRTLFDTRETIDLLFGKQEMLYYNEMPRIVQDKYRLYITRRKNFQQLYKNLFEPMDNCLSPSDWEQEYDSKKEFETIAHKLKMTIPEVMRVYNDAILKMRKYCDEHGIKLEDYLPE